MSGSPIYLAKPHITPNSWTNADLANAKKTVVTAGSNGSKVYSVQASSTETATPHVANIWLTRSGTSYLLTSQTVAINVGFDGLTPAVNLLALVPSLPHDNDGQAYLFLESGDTLQVSFTTQVTTGKEIDVLAIWADF